MHGTGQSPAGPRLAVLIPCYNNGASVARVAEGARRHLAKVLVVDDGSTDGTAAALRGLGEGIATLRLEPNQGKGAALLAGFAALRAEGFSHALTIDADGQHEPEDLPRFVALVRQRPRALIVGQRDMQAAGAPWRSRFGLACSNFVLRVAGVRLQDSQSGFRAYPLEEIAAIALAGRRYDLELEVLIKAARRGLEIAGLPIRCTYDPAEGRISHFRPLRDFLRIARQVRRWLRGP